MVTWFGWYLVPMSPAWSRPWWSCSGDWRNSSSSSLCSPGGWVAGRGWTQWDWMWWLRWRCGCSRSWWTTATTSVSRPNATSPWPRILSLPCAFPSVHPSPSSSPPFHPILLLHPLHLLSILLLLSFLLVAVVDCFYCAILCSRADSQHSHVILHEWLAFYSVFLNIHESGVLTVLAWLVPHETAAISALSVCTIQPRTMSLHAKPHM